MANKNTKVEHEISQDFVDYELLTDQGDHMEFLGSEELWSDAEGAAPSIRPNGLISGGKVTPAASGSNNLVDVAQAKCYLAGVETVVSAQTDLEITRGTDPNTHIVNSVTITAAGEWAVVAGSEGSAFSETRGAAGGPPFIPVDSIEVRQVRLPSFTSAAILATEIKGDPGVHCEMFLNPTWDIIYGQAPNGVLGYAGIKMKSALPLIHTGGLPKRVYASYYTPNFTELVDAYDMKVPEVSHSVSSVQTYSGIRGSVSESLGSGSFNVLLKDGISDALVGMKKKKLWWRFSQDRYKDPYILCQGYLAIARDWLAGSDTKAACTISATEEAMEVLA